MHRGFLVLCIAATGCSLGNSLDVCKRPRPVAWEVNVRTEGAQAASGEQPIAPLPGGGGAIVVFRSANAADDDGTGPASIRAAVVDQAGKPATRTCDAPGETDLAVGVVGVRNDDPSIAMPETTAEEVGLVVYTRRTATEQQVRGIFVTQGACAAALSVEKSFLISDAPIRNDFSSRPSVAWVGARTFVVAWTATSSLDFTSDVRLRVMRQDGAYTPSFLPTLGSPTGGSVSVVARPAIREKGRVDRLKDGTFAVLWFEIDGLTRVPHFAFADGTLHFAPPDRALDPTPAPPDHIAVPSGAGVSAAFDGAQVLLLWSGIQPDGTTRALGRYFTLLGQPLSSPQSPAGGPFLVRPDAVAQDTGRATLAPFNDGGFLVATEQGGGVSAGFNSIHGMAFGSDGAARFANLACDDTSFDLVALVGDVSSPHVVRASDGQIFAVFTTDGVAGADRSGSGVRVMSFAPRDLLPLR